MAYSAGALDLIVEWYQKGWIALKANSGVLELGAQEVNQDALDDRIWSFVNAFYPDAGDASALRTELAQTSGSRCHMSALCKAAGFRYLALDVDVRPGTVKFDLNHDRIDESWRGAFDFTTSYGTLEHVINQLNCLSIMHDVTAPGGTILLNLPFAGTLNHGIFQYNPKFVVTLAEANRYQLLYSLVSGPVYHDTYGSNFDIFDGDYHPYLERVAGSGNWANVKFPSGGYLVLLRKVHDAPFNVPMDYGSKTFERLARLP